MLQPQPQADAKQDQCTQNRKPELISFEFSDSTVNVLLWTDVDTLLTLEAVTADRPGTIRRKSDLRRAGLRTCFTSFSAIFSRSVKGEKRQYRKQGKYCSHRAEEPAKKSFLYTHAHHQKKQDHKTDHIASQTEIACMDHGKYIPRTCPLCLGINSGIAHQHNHKQDQIFAYR